MNVLSIFRGLPGSGKSTAIHDYLHSFRRDDQHTQVTVVCADDYFMKSGKYMFQPDKLGEAHAQCFRNCVEAVRAEHIVYVDNTNTTATEIAPYYALGRAYGYTVAIVHVLSDVETSLRRNVHGVGRVAVERMERRLREPLPTYWEVELYTMKDGNTVRVK